MVILYDRDQYDWCICHSVINGLGALHLTKMGVGFCGGACLVGGKKRGGKAIWSKKSATESDSCTLSSINLLTVAQAIVFQSFQGKG